MASLGSILSIASSALQAQQAAVAVASQNIANAGTEGYSRQRLELTASTPLLAPYGSVGTGVTLEGVTRARDTLLDSSYRDAAGKSAAYDLRSTVLARAEGIFGAPSDSGLGADLDAFWSSWSDLANAPTSGAARAGVVHSGRNLAASFSRAANQLLDIRGNVQTRLSEAVDTANRAAEQVALLNRQIVTAQAGGHQAPDLLDARDRLVDQLSTLGSVRTIPAQTGTISVILDGETIVDGTTTRAISMKGGGDSLALTVGGSTLASPAEGSTLGQMMQLLKVDLPALGEKLDSLANAVATKVNALHGSGVVYPSGDPGGDFFAVDGGGNTTAREMALTAAISANPALVAASGDPGGPTDNATALALAALREDGAAISGPNGDSSFGEFYRGIVTGLAGDTSAAKSSTEVFATLSARADTRRKSVSGVSIDEELIHLIQNQQAYTAASRLLTTVDEMMQSLLNF